LEFLRSLLVDAGSTPLRKLGPRTATGIPLRMSGQGIVNWVFGSVSTEIPPTLKVIKLPPLEAPLVHDPATSVTTPSRTSSVWPEDDGPAISLTSLEESPQPAIPAKSTSIVRATLGT
jgi:hypothetical protein